MRDFIFNLALFLVLAVVLYLIAPDIMGNIVGLYNGLGILPIFIIMMILAALPRRYRRRR